MTVVAGSSIAGTVVDADGRDAGAHRGAAAYTVGQRAGLGVALGERQYVASIDIGRNLVHLGRREDLQRDRFELDGLRLIDGRVPAASFRALVRIRHRAEPIGRLVTRSATAVPGWQRCAGVERDLERPVWAPAPGQAAVLYDTDKPAVVLGGGSDRGHRHDLAAGTGIRAGGVLTGAGPLSWTSRSRPSHRRSCWSVLVGSFHTCVYLVLRGVLAPHVLLVLLAAIVGAYLGQAVGGSGRRPDPRWATTASCGRRSPPGWAIILVVGLSSVLPARDADR